MTTFNCVELKEKVSDQWDTSNYWEKKPKQLSQLFPHALYSQTSDLSSNSSMWSDVGTAPSTVVLPGQPSTFPAWFCAVGRAAVIRPPADRGLSVHLLAPPSASAAHSSVSGEPSVTPQRDQASLSHHSKPVLKWAEVESQQIMPIEKLRKNQRLLIFDLSIV